MKITKRETRSPAKIRQRAKDLRRNPTPAEELLRQRLRNKRLGGYKFRRQHPIGNFIVDFYCDNLALIIELEGGIHKQQIDYDIARESWLEDRGYYLLRFPNQKVLDSIDEILAEILDRCRNCGLAHKKSR